LVAKKEGGNIAKVTDGADDIIELAPGFKGNWNKAWNGTLKPNSKYKVGDKIYETEELGKIGRNEYQQGKSVTLKDGTKGVDEGDEGVSKRPSEIEVFYKIDGKEYIKTFPNNKFKIL